MTNHTIRRDARGNVVDITGSCGDDDCPIEKADEDGVEYVCPVTNEMLAQIPAPDNPTAPDDRRPDSTDDIRSGRRDRRR